MALGSPGEPMRLAQRRPHLLPTPGALHSQDLGLARYVGRQNTSLISLPMIDPPHTGSFPVASVADKIARSCCPKVT